MKTLRQIENDIKLKATLINVPEKYFPTYGSSEGNARPHIDIGRNGYNYVVSERGIEHKRIASFDYNELLYLVIEGITFAMASDLELENRNENEDSRIQLFKIQEDLIGKIDETFRQRINRTNTIFLDDYLQNDGTIRKNILR